jgi:hypothetical protein
MAAFGGNESCPNCGARMAADQRYCLNCGHRRGDPRLPFMDAVTFMESMNAPPGGATPPPPPSASGGGSSRMNANAALIAGVATLVLAIGVGFLIGRSGHNNNAPAAAAAPQIIKVGGGGEESGGGETEVETEGSEEGAEAGGKGKKEAGKKKGGKTTKKVTKNTKASEVEENSQQEKELIQEKQKEVLHSEGPEAEVGVQKGDECKAGTPGCEGEEFTGNFFGE